MTSADDTSRTTAVLSPEHRLRSTALFSETVRRGRKKGSRTAVVSVYDSPSHGADRRAVAGEDSVPVTVGGPRVGLVVSKAVGNAVTRHAVSRRLRHVARRVITDPTVGLTPSDTVVLRALPASSDASSDELEHDVRHALRRILG